MKNQKNETLSLVLLTQDFNTELPKDKQELIGALSKGKKFTYQGFLSGVLSAAHPAEFVIDDIKYYSVLQYYMATKANFFGDTSALKQIMESRDADRIRTVGRKVRNYLEQDWNEVSVDIMRTGHLAKYSQNHGMFKVLVGTFDDILVECNSGNLAWGAGISMLDTRLSSPFEWPGQNKQGFLLMQVRTELLEKYIDELDTKKDGA